MKRIPRKPDRYKRGGIYLCDLPKQLVTEKTDRVVHQRDRFERYGSPLCVVISAESFTDSQANCLIGRADKKRRQRRPNKVQISCTDMGSDY
jgi:hypothetical protein